MSELEFRDGKRIVPDYMDDLMVGLPLRKLTYSQAVEAMNRQNVARIIDRTYDKMVADHFEDRRR